MLEGINELLVIPTVVVLTPLFEKVHPVKGIEKGIMKGIGKRIIPAVWAFFSDYYLHPG